MNDRSASYGVVISSLLFALTAPATAQRTLAHDTLSDSTPTAIQCGFCAGERYGVVFRELPAPARGLEGSDFPVQIRSLLIAVANARQVGESCVAATEGATVNVHLRVFAGTDVPTGDITASPTDMPWTGETLVYENPETPLRLSASSSGTADGYEIEFNRLAIVDEMERPILVEAPNIYLRVEITIGEGDSAMSDLCSSPNSPPNALPLLDRDGTIAADRNFIYAGGIGYLWNQNRLFDIMGDWAIRLEFDAMGPGPGPTDAGMVMDASPSRDAEPPGAEPILDSGPNDEADPTPAGGSDDGCGCRVLGAPSPARSSLLWASMLLIGILVKRRASPC